MNPESPSIPESRVYPMTEYTPRKISLLPLKEYSKLWTGRVRSTLNRRGSVGPVVLAEVELLVPYMLQAIANSRWQPDGHEFSPHLRTFDALVQWCNDRGFIPSPLTSPDTYLVAADYADIHFCGGRTTGAPSRTLAENLARVRCGGPSPGAWEVVAVHRSTRRSLAPKAP